MLVRQIHGRDCIPAGNAVIHAVHISFAVTVRIFVEGSKLVFQICDLRPADAFFQQCRVLGFRFFLGLFISGRQRLHIHVHLLLVRQIHGRDQIPLLLFGLNACDSFLTQILVDFGEVLIQFVGILQIYASISQRFCFLRLCRGQHLSSGIIIVRLFPCRGSKQQTLRRACNAAIHRVHQLFVFSKTAVPSAKDQRTRRLNGFFGLTSARHNVRTRIQDVAGCFSRSSCPVQPGFFFSAGHLRKQRFNAVSQPFVHLMHCHRRHGLVAPAHHACNVAHKRNVVHRQTAQFLCGACPVEAVCFVNGLGVKRTLAKQPLPSVVQDSFQEGFISPSPTTADKRQQPTNDIKRCRISSGDRTYKHIVRSCIQQVCRCDCSQISRRRFFALGLCHMLHRLRHI